MSGGSYDYAYRHVESFRSDLRRRNTSPMREAFYEHLELVSDAMRAIEWVDSGDYAPGDDDAAMAKVLAPGVEIAAAVKMADAARKMLEAAIGRAAQLAGDPTEEPT